MSIFNPSRIARCAAGVLFLSVLSSASAWARPSMWWDHFEAMTQDQSDCVRRAETILNTEKAGQLVADADSVRAWSEKTVGVAECIRFGDKLIVAILISSDDPAVGSKLYGALRMGLKK